MDRQDILNAMDALGGSIEIDRMVDKDGNRLDAPISEEEALERFVDIVMTYKEKSNE